MREIPKKWTDYEQCCTGGHNESNCDKNIISKAKFEEHNKVVDDFTAYLEEIANKVIEFIDKLPSTHYPISKIADKKYYYICKEDLSVAIKAMIMGKK